jgi:hypothetical protein
VASRGQTFASRHAIYRDVAEQLRSDRRVPAAVRRTRFFDAAAQITGATALGRLERWPLPWRLLERIGVIDAGARSHLDAISAFLLQRNLELARCIVIDWGELRSPLAPAGPALSALAFDEAMVVFEQRAVSEYLARHHVTCAAQRSIDRLLGLCASNGWRRILRFDRGLCEAVRGCFADAGRGAGFFDMATRVAIGQALVRRLHVP